MAADLHFDTIKLHWPAEQPTVVYAYLNRPRKRNAINKTMYEEITRLLRAVGERDGTDVLVLSGTGDYYSSGNDLSQFMEFEPASIERELDGAERMLVDMVDAWIDFPKILVCAVNGPAIGIAATTLGLADFVFASDRAFFETPFVRLGQAPEGCSSVLFPRMMGARANRFLLLGERVTAQQAYEFGFVTAVYAADDFGVHVAKQVDRIAALPRTALVSAKRLSRSRLAAELKQVNREECKLLRQLWASEETMAAVMNFFTSKTTSKL